MMENLKNANEDSGLTDAQKKSIMDLLNKNTEKSNQKSEGLDDAQKKSIMDLLNKKATKDNDLTEEQKKSILDLLNKNKEEFNSESKQSNDNADKNIKNVQQNNPKINTTEKQKKIYKAGVIDISKLAETQARDVADSRMTENKDSLTSKFSSQKKSWLGRLSENVYMNVKENLTTKKGISDTGKRIWKHNLAQEWYRQREIKRVKDEILKSGNLYAGETKDVNITDYEKAKTAIVGRFVSEYEDDMLKMGEKESKKQITDEETKKEIKDLIQMFASDSNMSEAAFKEQQKRILVKKHSEYLDNKKMYADNLLDIAKEIRNLVIHGEKLSEMDFDVEITLGRAQETLNTEAKNNNFEKIVEKTQNSKLGKYLFNEASSVVLAAGLYEAARFFGVKALRSKAAKWATFGGTALFAGGIAASKEAARVNRERAQHMRERAKGMEFTGKDMERRNQMEENRYETKNAGEIIKVLEQGLEKVSSGNINEAEFDAIMINLSDLEARIKIGDKNKLDLISYSKFNEVEKERMSMDLNRAKLKVALRNGIKNGSIDFTKGCAFDEYLQKLSNTQSSETFSKEIEEKDKLFKEMKRKKVAATFMKTTLISGAAGFVFQEMQAAFDSHKDGIIEGMIKNDEHLSNKATALEALRRYVTGDEPRIPFGHGHEILLGNTHMQLPDGISMSPNGNGTFDVISGGKTLIPGFKPEFDANGDLTKISKEILKENNIFSDFSQTGEKVTEHITKTAEDWAKEHHGGRVSRSWMGNDTSMHGRDPVTGKWILERDPVTGKLESGADLNELRTQFVGNGIDGNGDYVMTVKHMTNDGSFQNGISVAAHDLMKQGKLEVLLSVTKGTQHFPIKVLVGPDGLIHFDHTKPEIKALFENVGGHVKYNGAFIEIAHSTGVEQDGAEHMQILGTYEGTGHPGNIIEEITKDTTAPNVKLNFPTQWDYEVPPVIPITRRKPLESMIYTESNAPLEYYLNYNGLETTEEEEKYFESVRSQTLKENPSAKLDHYKEIEQYFGKFDKNYLERINRLARQIDPMDKECKVSINIPVAGHQEANNIYESLENYTRQTVDTKNFELVLFVNHPETDKKGNKLDAKNVLDEINRFKKDYPNIKTEVIYEVLTNKEANIGLIRKLMNDTTLLRHHQRGSTADDLIMISNDADNKGIDTRYVEAFMESFKNNPDVDGFLGQLDWDPESYQKFPDIHIGTRLFQYLNVIGRHHTKRMTSSGANSAFKSSIYAAIGGYRDNIAGGEDAAIRKAIVAARGVNESFAFAGIKSRLFTSSRRAIVMLKQFGIAPLDQWRKGFSVQGDEEIRKLIMEDGPQINYDDKETLDKLKKSLEYVINETIDQYEIGEKIGKNAKYYKKALGWLGIKYTLDKNKNISIVDMSSLIDGLKRYQVEGKLMRDARSGKKDAQEKLDEIRGKSMKIENQDIHNKTLDAIERYIDEIPGYDKRIDALKNITSKILNNESLNKIGIDTKISEINRRLDSCQKIDNGKEFIEEIRKIFGPISIALEKNPVEAVEFERKAFNEFHNFTPINEIFSYKIDNGDLHLHMAPSKDISAKSKIRFINDALEKLISIVEKNKKIKEISATSWIVAKNPKLLERFGFKNLGPISDKERKENFNGETNQINRAVIKRREFLNKYSKQNNSGLFKKIINTLRFKK